MRRSLIVLAAILLAVFWLASCSRESSAPSQIVLQLATDLVPGTELTQVLVEVLDERGEGVHREQWFDARTECSSELRSEFVLGSLTLTQGKNNLIRVRVSGFLQDTSGQLHEVLAGRFDVRFEDGEPLAFEWLLTRSCYQLDDACTESTTCEPATGRCVSIPLLNSQRPLSSVSRAADCIAPSEGGYGPVVAVFDAGVQDAEPDAMEPDSERLAQDDGTTESPASDAGTDTLQGAASDAAACEEKLAVCCEVDMLRSADHCGACGQACSASNITPVCSAGSCGGECNDGFKDCNQDKRTDGCETDLSKPESCGACDNQCSYGRCEARRCEFKVSGIEIPETSMPIAAAVALGAVTLPAVGRKVVAAGVWVDLLLPGVQVSLAIYKDSLRTPYDPATLVAQTGPLPAVDNPLSGLAPVDGFVRVEAPLNIPFVVEKFTTYWLFVAVSADTRIGTYRADAITEWAQWSGAFDGFHEFIDPFDYLDRQNLATYLVSTAE